MISLIGAIDLAGLFNAEIHRIDGQDVLYIPLKENQSLRIFGGHPTLLVQLFPMSEPDSEGYTFVCKPFIPKFFRDRLQEADLLKMNRTIGRFREIGPKQNAQGTSSQPPEIKPALDYHSLAGRAVNDKDIPL